MRYHSLFMAGLVTTALLSAAALAQPFTPGMGPARFDLNQDGTLTAEEIRQTREASFVTADADRDGKLTRAEVGNLPTAMGRGAGSDALRMTRYDGDGDGLVTRAEYLARQPQWLARMDANQDGAVTPEEWRAGPRGGGKDMGPCGGGSKGWNHRAW